MASEINLDLQRLLQRKTTRTGSVPRLSASPSALGGEDHATRTNPLLIGLVLLSLLALLWINRSFMKPLLMGAVFAITVSPTELWLRTWLKSSYLRAAVLTSAVAITFILPVGIVAYLAANFGLRFVNELPENWSQGFNLTHFAERLAHILPFDQTEIAAVLDKGSESVTSAILGVLKGLLADLPKLSVDNALIVAALFVYLAEKEALLSWLRKASPMSLKTTKGAFQHIASLSRSVILATIASGFVQALLLGLGALFAGYSNAALITMSAFVLSFIPVIGTAPVTLVLIGISAAAQNWHQLGVLGAFAVLASLSDNFVRPLVLSGGASLHPLIGLIAAFGGLEAMGFYGLFLGPICVGTALYLIEVLWINRGEKHDSTV